LRWRGDDAHSAGAHHLITEPAAGEQGVERRGGRHGARNGRRMQIGNVLRQRQRDVRLARIFEQRALKRL
jgi:hypothetical protein